MRATCTALFACTSLPFLEHHRAEVESREPRYRYSETAHSFLFSSLRELVVVFNSLPLRWAQGTVLKDKAVLKLRSEEELEADRAHQRGGDRREAEDLRKEL